MGNAISETGTLTTIHLAWLVVFAVLVVIGLIYGARLKRQRRDAQKIDEQRIEAAQDAPADPKLVTTDDSRHEKVTPTSAPSAEHRDAVPRARESAESSAEPAPLAEEPIAAGAPFDASPATMADPTPAPLPSAANDAADAPVTTLKGLGPKVAARLGELGITSVGQIAALDDAQADALDAELGTFRGRMARDRWIEQARFLAAGDRAGFEAVFGKL